jgi:hypothetical protein
MDNPRFRPGFRLSVFDVLLLGLGTFGALRLWPNDRWLALIVVCVVGHFFLFCNIFRISRGLELLWGAVFVGVTLGTRQFHIEGWIAWFLPTLAMTVVVVVIEMRKPSYHGIAWRRINPHLREWWEENVPR